MQIEDFDAFFTALHGRPPFPWQSRLAKQLGETGVWPSVLNLPTSAGKTAALDVALFHLIVEAAQSPAQRRAPRRIFFVVDRRLVVDEAYQRATNIAEALVSAQDGSGILADAAAGLLNLAGKGAKQPLVVRRLRGGLPMERAFLGNPLQPAVILTTVDQLGSRLLFRGYGVSANMRPIHAALAAMDSLILLDEAHMSRPFLQTLQAVTRYQSSDWSERQIRLPHAVVQMTATPGDTTDAFELNDKDYDHELLQQRLQSAKPAELEEVKEASALAKALADKAIELSVRFGETLPAPVIGVVANRVATAREVFERVNKECESVEAILLTGRIRPADRDRLLKTYLPRIKAGRSGAEIENSKPLFVVATQTIEVGADLDFDGLVTESASLDALRQRFGRLNRLGERPHCLAAVIHAKSNKDDLIYGEALTKTWKWLNEHSEKIKGKKSRVFDLGILRLNALLAKSDISALYMLPVDAPVLLPAHLDVLVQTSPSPRVSPDPALLLHGPNSREEDVQVVWRADVPKNFLIEDLAILQVLPPSSHEALAIPLSALRAFLHQIGGADANDLEGLAETGETIEFTEIGKPVAVWRGANGAEVVSANRIRPGDLVVLPAIYGGADEFGWHPANAAPVSDVAELDCLTKRGKFYLRLHPALVSYWFESDSEVVAAEIQRLIANWQQRLDDGETELAALYSEVLQVALDSESLSSSYRTVIGALLREKISAIPYVETDASKGVLLVSKRNVAQTLVDDGDALSLSREVGLEQHSQGVAGLARDFSLGLGLPPDLVSCIEIAALYHDLGKADPRFQAMLQGGVAQHEKWLAKSGMNAADRIARQLARKIASYPNGQRHECYSVALLRANPQLLELSSDPELTEYLVGSHHGHGRPWMPAISDEGTDINFLFDNQSIRFCGVHGLERLDAGWPDLFWRLIRRYGYWGLSFLETVVRLADQQRSEWESKNETND
ncbi:hypothetical protein A1507_21670 [Methylomonas koyamae]|uniref:HD Cas3-type domain-containing protein n=1 Tax=Methylomonas koyamae TaxID=702114 RepID=A0A177MXG5_9GAMM|nr:type I-U CRISPR-associated helicase/endonuclease Cas3 [Methylomonas koyamae]OAI10311.1 hypothetical protein A1507_21670 [Methylomonas koyamae]